MSQDLQRVQLTPQTDLHDVVEQVHADQIPRKEGEPLAVVSPVEPTPAQTVQAFYEKMAKRPDVRELLTRLAKK